MASFKKPNSGKTITVFASVGALVGSGVIGCGGQASKQQDWMATDVATGRINLDAVKDALETSQDLSGFEKRVNEIYEGDNLVLIRVEEKGVQKIISGFEDLNQSNAIEETKDDKLFSITVEEDKYEVYGHSTNDYYYYGSDYWYDSDSSDDRDYSYDYDYSDDDNKAFMHWLMHAPLSPRDPLMYQTSRNRAAQMRRDRDNFRNSAAYTSQRRANKAFFTQQKARNPQAFSSKPKNVSSPRSNYQQKPLSRIEASRSAPSSGSIRSGS